MKILAVALLVVAMTALTTADDDDSIENPAPEDMVPEIPLNETTQTDGFPQSTGAVRRKRWARAPTWKKWRGIIPYRAVRIYNRNRRRVEWVCKVGCQSGFYTPTKGSYCHYPWGEREYRARQFEILVRNNNQRLKWRWGAWGSLPKNSVKTCSGYDIYVGKNKYGLGKVHKRHKAFFIAKDGKEKWYKWYDVLTF